MASVTFKGKTYETDEEDFLVHPDKWDEDFAEGMAPKTGISGGLSPMHWEVVRFIREVFSETGKCPMVHETCRIHNLRTADLARLFPSGYLRGACRLAGLSYRAEDIHPSWFPKQRTARVSVPLEGRVYRVNVRGFLIDPAEWDEDFAVFKSREMKMPGALSEKHWQIIQYLRAQFAKTKRVPTVYETCAANGIDIEELGELFPDGYHRGAVKISGLHAI